MSVEVTVPKCMVCGEDMSHGINSLSSQVHRWGPTNHDFRPDRSLAEYWRERLIEERERMGCTEYFGGHHENCRCFTLANRIGDATREELGS